MGMALNSGLKVTGSIPTVPLTRSDPRIVVYIHVPLFRDRN